MNVHEWHRRGLEPAFATVEQWINDQLGYMGAEDEACFAVEIRPENARGGLAVRILLATDQGLVDLLWERPDNVAQRHLSGRHYRWSDVRGVHLLTNTRLDAATLTHLEPEWGIEIADPEFRIERADEGMALLEFWKRADKELMKAAKGG